MTRKIAFIWRKNSDNIGDRYSGWPLYFEFPEHDELDLDEVEHGKMPLDQYTHVVIGGGLYPDPKWYPHVHSFCKNNKKVLQIGVGTNGDTPECRVFFRQNFPGREIIPCPSCMHKVFDKSYPQLQILKAYDNPDFPSCPGPVEDRMTNRNDMHELVPIENAIKFIGTTKTLFTSSYHGAYWASLLGIDFEVFSNRSKFEYPIWEPSGWNLGMARRLCRQGYYKILLFLEDQL
jgi:hypothetical protein